MYLYTVNRHIDTQKPLVIVSSPNMLLRPPLSFGADKLHIFSTFAKSVAMPSSGTTCPKKAMLVSKSSHFLALANRLYSHRQAITNLRFAKVSSNKLPKMITSSKLTRHFLSMRPSKTLSIILENVAGATVSPKGIQRNSYKPRCEPKAVFSLSLSATLICQ